MTKKSYSQEVSDTQVMLSGIRENLEALTRRGINEAFAGKLQATLDACINLNNEQEQLKARLKNKTAELNLKMKEMKKRTSEARKIIKLDIPKSSWREFGIEDKQ